MNFLVWELGISPVKEQADPTLLFEPEISLDVQIKKKTGNTPKLPRFGNGRQIGAARAVGHRPWSGQGGGARSSSRGEARLAERDVVGDAAGDVPKPSLLLRFAGSAGPSRKKREFVLRSPEFAVVPFEPGAKACF